jgi:ATPase subunit of ABC transporter with duplicated ATPase domains
MLSLSSAGSQVGAERCAAYSTVTLGGLRIHAREQEGNDRMIEAKGLRKQYGETVAVDGLTFDVRPGIVTGFLGPNGLGAREAPDHFARLERFD